MPNLYVEEVSLFTEWVLGGSKPEIDGENGLKNQMVIDRAMEGIPECRTRYVRRPLRAGKLRQTRSTGASPQSN